MGGPREGNTISAGSSDAILNSDARLSIILSAIGIIGIPTLVFIIRATIKWTRVEDRLETISNKLIDIVRDKDEVHKEMLAQMREDRDATNRRLRWLEENVWKSRGHPTG